MNNLRRALGLWIVKIGFRVAGLVPQMALATPRGVAISRVEMTWVEGIDDSFSARVQK